MSLWPRRSSNGKKNFFFFSATTKELLNHVGQVSHKERGRKETEGTTTADAVVVEHLLELLCDSCATSACVIYYIPSAEIIYIHTYPPCLLIFFFLFFSFDLFVLAALQNIYIWHALESAGTGCCNAHANGRSLWLLFFLIFLFLFCMSNEIFIDSHLTLSLSRCTDALFSLSLSLFLLFSYLE